MSSANDHGPQSGNASWTQRSQRRRQDDAVARHGGILPPTKGTSKVRESIAGELRAFGWLVLEAATGEQVVALAPDNQIDAVFTDIQLGDGISGWETAVALRAKLPSIPIVYTSAGRCEPERQVSGSLFVSKPYEPAFIIETCNNLIEDGSSDRPALFAGH